MALTLPYADDLRSHRRLVKPTKLERQAAKQERIKAIAKVRKKQLKADLDAFAELRAKVYARDHGCCRAYGTPVKLRSDNPLIVAHAHHIVFRSAGGADISSNLVTLCPKAHYLIHQHLLSVEGDGDGTVTFTLRDGESGDAVESWDSPGGAR